ncbi:28S ribosomal protein S24-A, mitochondrial-like [Actinia tenebrosa]|uniref:28S ribosomal protein S24-A, mitochondrial-like n=1 Tax=Actinia tenebrosa TaxID=6105 RepID=A0A6P8ICD0_ACTTE|nr:28S ribosomal protein S24-A, mitochondrial-like [Actinia tenebrosa]
MAGRACVNVIKKSFLQLSRNGINPKVSTCYSAMNHYPEILGIMGVRFATKAKPLKGGVKTKAVPGYRVAVTKGFESQHTGSLKGSYGASDRLLDDVMMRKYIEGVFYDHVDSDIVIKRRDNRIIIAFVVKRDCDVNKFYFLTAMSEKLLSEVFSCIVKFEPQSSAI